MTCPKYRVCVLPIKRYLFNYYLVSEKTTRQTQGTYNSSYVGDPISTLWPSIAQSVYKVEEAKGCHGQMFGKLRLL